MQSVLHSCRASRRDADVGRRHRLPRHAQALVEFGIIAFVISAIVAGLLGIAVMALGSFQNNIVAESAGRVLDEQISETGITNAQSLYEQLEIDGLYDEQYLILTRTQFYDSTFKQSLPPINRMLLPQYIFDPDDDSFRHPGAIVENSDGQRTVLIPLLETDAANRGRDRSFSVDGGSYPVADDWVAPVTVAAVRPSATGGPTTATVAFFHPSQPGSMIDLEVIRDADGREISQIPVVADDASAGLSALPIGYSFSTPTSQVDRASTSRGQYGLGESFAFATSVRPFRLVFETATSFQLISPASP